MGDIRKLIPAELSSLYPPGEIESIINIIIKTVFNDSKLHHIVNQRYELSDSEMERAGEIISRLKTGSPVQYVLGETLFYSCRITVNNNVLIPRQETEELVDIIIKENRNFAGSIADLGTGSGCIAVALAKFLPDAKVIAADNSVKALETARANAAINEVRIEFLYADILNIHKFMTHPSDIIVSNPPYVRESEKKQMHINVLGFEPHNALFVPDDDPLIYYRKIFEHSRSLLLPGGKIYLEINEAMGKRLPALAEGSGYIDISVLKDLNGKDRIMKGIYNGRE